MSKRGFTLIEMLVVVTIIGLLVAIVAPRLGPAVQKQNVRSARDLIVTMHAKARAIAVRRGLASGVIFDGNQVYIAAFSPVSGAIDTIGAVEDLNDRFRVTVSASRDTLAFDGRGLPIASNAATIRVSLGVYADTIAINSWGRLLR